MNVPSNLPLSTRLSISNNANLTYKIFDKIHFDSNYSDIAQCKKRTYLEIKSLINTGLTGCLVLNGSVESSWPVCFSNHVRKECSQYLPWQRPIPQRVYNFNELSDDNEGNSANA